MNKKIFLVSVERKSDLNILYHYPFNKVELTTELEEKITKEIIYKELGYIDDYDRGVIQKVFQKFKESVWMINKIKTALFVLVFILLLPFILILAPLIAVFKGYENEN